MALWDDFKDAWTDEVLVADFLGNSEDGVGQYGSPVSYMGRVVYEESEVRAPDGSIKISTAYVWLTYEAVVDPRAQITLADNDQRYILKIDRFKGGVTDGPSHVKVYFG